MRRLMIVVALACGFVGAVRADSEAPELMPFPWKGESDLDFSLDCSAFRATAGHTDVELYVSLPNAEMRFDSEEDGGVLAARVLLTIRIENMAGEEVFATDVVHVYRVQKIPGDRFVRVYHDGPSDRGFMRAPTGRIIVKFKPDWTAPAITTWATAEGLGDAHKLGFGKNLWTFRVGAGAIAKATGYHESGRFEWVSPDWWKSASKR